MGGLEEKEDGDGDEGTAGGLEGVAGHFLVMWVSI